MAVATIAVILLALAQAAPEQGSDVSISGLLGEAVTRMGEANVASTILYVVSFAVGVTLASIAIYATHGNTSKLNRQLENYEERTRLLREDIDVGFLPVLAWSRVGERPGEPEPTSAGGKRIIVRIVNAGRAPALRATAEVKHRIVLNGDEKFERRGGHHSWGAILPNDFVEMHVTVPEEAVETVEGMRGGFRADVLLECRSFTGERHSTRMAVTYDMSGVALRDVTRDEWRRDIGLDGGDGDA
ncbi:MAG: hypothetical protein EB824_04900 [Thaumarchaeota archaeon S15]|nr:MAG: hypothetical protein EB824_04900 [Thaumarchaeota archaeon S15]